MINDASNSNPNANSIPNPAQSTAEQLAQWADQLRHMSANGLTFANNIYDRENYQHIQTIAMGLMALATGQTLAEIEPLRGPIFSRPMPLPTVDAAIINSQGQILLIQRADNQKWAMPGGGTDVGESPAQAAAREALEESGVRCQPIALVAVHDSRLCGSKPRHQLYMITFLCLPLDGGIFHEPVSHAHEVLDKGWFAQDALPADLDPGHVTRIPEAFRVWRGDKTAYFDRA